MKTFLSALISAALMVVSLAGRAAPLPDDDWLHTQGNQIVDKNGNVVWLTGANWFGFNATERTFHGLWSVNLESTLQSIADRGINILRVPISTELLWEWRNGQFSIPGVNTSTNADLVGLNNLEVFDRFLQVAKQLGLKVMLDVHSAEADNSGHVAPLWYKGNITPEIFYQSWEWVTNRYKNDDTIIAMDIENEPHGQPWSGQGFAKWDDSTDINNFKHACETASRRILAINANLLVLCEGVESYPTDGITWTSTNRLDYLNTWWGGNLRGVRDFPIDLGANQDQLVYSPHDYGPLVFQQPWFYPGFNRETLYNDAWKDNWMFIHEEGIAPLLLGEWGGFIDGGDNEKWMTALRDQIVEFKLHHTFWAINPNSGDTGGLLNNDWTTWDEEKYALVKPALWQNSQGKFISLDHEVPLGSNATSITVKEFYANAAPSVGITSPVNNTDVVKGTSFALNYSFNRVAGVNVYLNNTLVESAQTSGSVTLTAPSQLGTFTARLVAVDGSGLEQNLSTSVTLNAVDEIILPTEITISTPVNNTSVNTGDNLNLEVTYANASGFTYVFDTQSDTVVGTTATLNAPLAAGDYTLTVTAVDQNNQPLNASDSVTVVVTNQLPSELTCAIGTADVWPGGFVINSITLTNNGASPISGWSVGLSFPQSVQVGNSWNSVFSGSGADYTVINAPYNANISSGQSVSFGLQGSYSGAFGAPTCVVN